MQVQRLIYFSQEKPVINLFIRTCIGIAVNFSVIHYCDIKIHVCTIRPIAYWIQALWS
jgi:hypothetical protein